jgi:oxygen-independent coproporphyrinogen-3 oxidase
VHVPFCEFRCGFCNLFTQSNPREGLIERFLQTLELQAKVVADELGETRFARFALGGGTPTQLEPAGLARVFDLAERLGVDTVQVPSSIEFSPDTTTEDRVRLLVERGVERASIGVQSFLESESRAAGRPQKTEVVHRALTLLREFPVLNLDLIYGIPGQTRATWRESIQQALRYRPEELFLYPLYVRALTGLERRLPVNGVAAAPEDPRLDLYRYGRELLLDAGYTQVSMRLFRRGDAPQADGPAYCCQEDGMLGLGCGARSYTREVHYASEYAVGARGVKEIVASWVERDDDALRVADFGDRLDPEDQRRRFVIQSLLWRSGVVFADYRRRFGSEALDDLPQLLELEPRGLASRDAERLRLTPAGLEVSDVLGPWLHSRRVQDLMAEYEAR